MSGDAAAKIAERLTEVWRISRPTVLERMALLHSSCDRLTRNPEDTEARTQGRDAAHKLSGVLGVFGMPLGSEVASGIEFLLKSDRPLSAGDLRSLSTHIADLDAVIASKPDH